MYLDHRLGGRQERRLPVMVAVNLAPLEPTHRERHERTYTDNLSAHAGCAHAGAMRTEIVGIGSHRERHERTYTDNLSAHDARVRATCAWQLGEHAEITPVSGEATVRGEVVYCQRLDNDRFFVGVKIRESHIPWSILRRFVAFR